MLITGEDAIWELFLAASHSRLVALPLLFLARRRPRLRLVYLVSMLDRCSILEHIPAHGNAAICNAQLCDRARIGRLLN